MTLGAQAPQKILAVLDDSDTQTALRSAASLAEKCGSELTAFACVEPPQDIGVFARLADRTTDGLLEEMRDRRLTEARAQVNAHLLGRTIPIHVSMGKTFVEVIRRVVHTQTDFLVKSAEPMTGIHRYLFTSTDQHLLRKCPCPVWLQTQNAPVAPTHVLAAVDVDGWDAEEPETLYELNRRVVEAALCIAAPFDAQVTVLHAWEAVGEGMVWAFSSSGNARAAADAYVNEVLEARRVALEGLVQQIAQDHGHSNPARLVPRLARGTPEQVIEAQSRALGAEVVVMGTVARTGLSGVFIGNTAENIINNLEGPVLAVKPEGFVSPLGTL